MPTWVPSSSSNSFSSPKEFPDLSKSSMIWPLRHICLPLRAAVSLVPIRSSFFYCWMLVSGALLMYHRYRCLVLPLEWKSWFHLTKVRRIFKDQFLRGHFTVKLSFCLTTIIALGQMFLCTNCIACTSITAFESCRAIWRRWLSVNDSSEMRRSRKHRGFWVLIGWMKTNRCTKLGVLCNWDTPLQLRSPKVIGSIFPNIRAISRTSRLTAPESASPS